MFANADSLFYYAREARLTDKLLSPEEIQALLNYAREPSTTVTMVPTEERQGQEGGGGGGEEGESEEGEGDDEEECGGRGKGKKECEGEGVGEGYNNPFQVVLPIVEEDRSATQFCVEPVPRPPPSTHTVSGPPANYSQEEGEMVEEQPSSQISAESWMLEGAGEEVGEGEREEMV